MLGKGLESLIPPSQSDEGTQVPSGGQAGEEKQGAAFPSLGAQAEPQQSQGEGAAGSGQPQEGVSAPPALSAENRDPISPKDQQVFEKKKPYPQRPPEAIFHIEVEKIAPNPHQPRRNFNEEGINELAASIREFGMLQPLIVTKIEREVPTGTEVEYQLIAGERRLLAAKKLGLERVPAIVKNVDLERERLEMAVIENIQRENLNPIETARAFAKLQDEFRLTQREIASRLGKSREVIANSLRLLDLPPYIQEAIAANQITESHGRLLLTVADPGVQQKLFEDLVANRLTTRELKNRVRPIRQSPEEESEKSQELSPELKMLQERLSAELGAPVTIRQHGDPPASGGKITITFYSPEELKHIVSRLGGED